MQVTPQLLLEYNTPRAAATQLLVLARGGGTSAMPPERLVVTVSGHEEPGVPESPPSGMLTAPPLVQLWEWGRGVYPLDRKRLRASGAVVHGKSAWRRDAPTLFFLPGLPGVCGLELYRMHQHLSAWRVVGLPYAALAAQLGDSCTAATLAKAIVRRVKLLRPRAGTTVALAGYSAGALVAAQVATLLEAEGEAVAAICREVQSWRCHLPRRRTEPGSSAPHT